MAADADSLSLQVAFLDWLAEAQPRLTVPLRTQLTTPEIHRVRFWTTKSGSLAAILPLLLIGRVIVGISFSPRRFGHSG